LSLSEAFSFLSTKLLYVFKPVEAYFCKSVVSTQIQHDYGKLNLRRVRGAQKMLKKVTCEECQGTGIVFIETSSFFGIIRKQIPTSCPACAGKGFTLKEPPCKFCNGEGLVGNEREVCRVCNGTGYGDEFRWIPRNKLVPGTTFNRVCAVCKKRTVFEIVTPIEEYTTITSWHVDESMRERAIGERVRVRCRECGDSYYVDIDPDFHQELTDEVKEYLSSR